MKSRLGAKSIFFFLLSVLFLVLLTLFESSLAGLPLTAERILSLLLLVVPAIIGTIFGVLSIVRKESKLWTGVLGILLNALFALFHLFLLSFAG
jgi:nicotinamide riboside transporter PnuC